MRMSMRLWKVETEQSRPGLQPASRTTGFDKPTDALASDDEHLFAGGKLGFGCRHQLRFLGEYFAALRAPGCPFEVV